MLMLLFLIGVTLEVLLVTMKPLWRFRVYMTALVVLIVGVWSGIYLIEQWGVWALFVSALTLFRLFNMLRVAKGRMHQEYLRHVTRRTSLLLILLQTVIYLGQSIKLPLFGDEWPLFLALVQMTIATAILGVTARNLYKTRHQNNTHFYADKDLPTVTVAIPARNETADLSSCLSSIVANDYPKLEILVLDDCSQDRTPDIIRDFAQDGVRFIQGDPPKDRWLAKNQAYERLLNEASGELVLFCGVDVRFGSQAIRSLVTTMLNREKTMVSVMPFRIGGGVKTAFIQPMRYWWELALPRRPFNRPPVLSTCWLVRRKALKRLGGFSAVSRTVVPEGYFARELVKNDGYSFIRADGQLDIRTVKSVEGQLSTAIRTHYPRLRKRPENVLLLSMFEVLFLLLPFAVVLFGLLTSFSLATWLAVITCFQLVMTHYLIMAASNPSQSVVALVNLPLAVITEFVLIYLSMYRYEFGVVNWKGRNVCIPVMHVVPKLPEVPSKRKRAKA